MDIPKTREYYSKITRENICSCVYCQNFIDEVKNAYPEAAAFLSALGADIEKPFEVFLPLDPTDGYMDYFGVQYLICGSSEGFEDTKAGDISFFVTPAHPSAAYKGEYFVIQSQSFHIKCRYDKYNFD